jgi:hypothetical protein
MECTLPSLTTLKNNNQPTMVIQEDMAVLEEFACLPEFVLVSTIVSIGSVRPNQCLGVTLFSYFRFLFITHGNYSVKRQGNLLTEILLLHVINMRASVHQYVSTSVRQYASTPVRQCGCSTSVRQYVSTSVRQYVSPPVRQYGCTTSVHQYISTSVRHIT